MRIIEISINANLLQVKYLKVGSSPFSILSYVPRLDPASQLHMLGQYTIWVYSIKDLLDPGGEHTLILKGFAGSRGGGTYFNIENGDDQFFLIFDRK